MFKKIFSFLAIVALATAPANLPAVVLLAPTEIAPYAGSHDPAIRKVWGEAVLTVFFRNLHLLMSNLYASGSPMHQTFATKIGEALPYAVNKYLAIQPGEDPQEAVNILLAYLYDPYGNSFADLPDATKAGIGRLFISMSFFLTDKARFEPYYQQLGVSEAVIGQIYNNLYIYYQ